MPYDYKNPALIKRVMSEIESFENRKRKDQSLKQFEVYMDRMEPFVKKYLEKWYSGEDVMDLPLITSINLCKRIVKQEAGVYKTCPTRTFENVTDEQKLVLEQVYKDLEIDTMLAKSNEYFKLQAQNNIQIIPFKGKLKMRVLLNHQFDVIPDEQFPEMADSYILGGFDKSMSLPQLDANQDNSNQTIADPDDYKTMKLSVLWSNDYNFLINSKGEVVGEMTPNPIGICPFVDISPAKDFEFFVRQGQSVTDFTIQFNASLTDMSQIVRLQGFAQAYMIASEGMMPTSMKIGPAICVRMPVNPNQPEVRPEFGFAQPNADLEGSMKFLESMVALFLTSRGLDPKTISANGEGNNFSSGMERLLSMIEKFEASRSDFAVYESAEKKIFQIIKAYLNTYSGTDILQYNIAPLREDAALSIKFEPPELIETEADKMAMIEKKLDLGLMSKVEAIAEDRDISREEAEKVKLEIDADMQMNMPEVQSSLDSNQQDPPVA